MSESRSVLVAIHQPNFFPWLGYFDKIARADVFIVLDDVQFEKSGSGTWSNRVRLMVAGQPAWVTMPIRRDYHGVRHVNEMQIDNGQPWREKLLKTIRASYARARYCAETFALIEPWVRNPTDSLAEYNVAAITSMRAALGLPARVFTRSSSLGVTLSATDRLIDLVKAVGGTAYLAGGGAAGYQEDERFAAAALQLRYQRYEHPVYAQRPNAEFVPGLSCLDAMFHCGAAGAGEMLIAQARAAAAGEAAQL
jgi:hypothetical protein